jgi:uncharacterized protein (TIGR00288 family)
VSPWWLRPPGEESDEPETARGRRDDKGGSQQQGVPSIADLVGGRAALEQAAQEEAEAAERAAKESLSEAAAPVRESGGFFAPRRALEIHPSEANEPAYGDASDAAEIADESDNPELADSADSSDTSDGSETSDAPEGSEPAERSGRRRRRRGGRGRSRGGVAAAPATSGDGEVRAAGAKESPREWEEEDDEDDDEDLARQLIMSMPVAVSSQRQAQEEERKIALFCDLENVALGVRDSESKKFDINLVLERLVEKGKIIVKRAYADWERYSEFKIPFHEAAIELIDIPQRRYTGKNSADIKMVVDAMDLSYSKEHLDTFVLLSGDSDFSPLVSKLKENNKYVIGIGVKNSSSNLLIDNCDEFIFYEDVWRDQQKGPALTGLTKKKAEVFQMLTESILALQRENKDVLWGSMIKQTMKRKKPSFNEGYYGYSTFSELLQDAERNGLLKLRKDERSGSWVVMGFAKKR